MKFIQLFTLIISAIFISSCSTEKDFKNRLVKTLEDNPEILFNTIKKNPDRFMATVQNAAQEAKSKMAQRAKNNETNDLEKAIENPLKPKITSNNYFRGTKDAPITIVEYSDFQCPFCSRGKDTVTQLMKKYPGKIRFIYKHLPLSFHPQAMISAQYFEAIALQSSSKAFEFHDLIFENQAKLKLGEAYLTTLATKVGVNLVKLKKDINSKRVKDIIEEHKEEARSFNIQGTPGFIINGIPVRGAYPAEYFEQLISKLVTKGKLKL
jgi:protein-disulfide isomerase